MTASNAANGPASDSSTGVSPYSVILVDAEAGPEGERRVTVAADLARRCGAHLQGLSAGALRTYYLAEDVGFALTELVAKDQAELNRDLADAEKAFARIAGERGVMNSWRSAVEIPGNVFAEAARSADLLVVGGYMADDGDYFRRPDIGDLIMQAGRPILIVPPSVTELRLGKVSVAWKDTREARRALADGIGIMRLASSVTLWSICEEGQERAAEDALRDVRAYLARHGIDADLTVRAGDAEDAAIGLAESSDVIIAGAYGHSRVREWVFGGVTRTLLEESPNCLLLSR